MIHNHGRKLPPVMSEQDSAPLSASSDVPMLTPAHARRILCRRTGGLISRTTFYRWLNSGRVYSIRMGYRFFIPWPALEDTIKQSLEGERY